ncbi:hypothetical protein, partial [Pseudomonas sp. AU11447]|uniref:hypothetical protein n=1 Tax=Pseudomonas sp. AU11447 TaxID=1843184 RepID=UPI001C45B651
RYQCTVGAGRDAAGQLIPSVNEEGPLDAGLFLELGVSAPHLRVRMYWVSPPRASHFFQTPKK